MMKVLSRIIERAREDPKRIVMCEGEDERVLRAAVKAVEDGVARITLVGNRHDIMNKASIENIDVTSLDIVDPDISRLRPALVDRLFAIREKKGMTREEAEQLAFRPLCFAYLMVSTENADGCIAGAVNTTADVVRNAIQILGLDLGSKIVSSFFLMILCQPHHARKGGVIFSDCGLVIEPDSEQLASIGIAAAKNAESLLEEQPRLAMLSFSTNGSAAHRYVDKVIEAARRIKSQSPELAIDEDIQFDAAIVPEVAERKLPGSRVKGNANVFIFPNLESGNIGYKIAERIGGAKAIGPFLQGLAKPANDLSRGCSVEDIYHVIAVTTIQAQENCNCKTKNV